MYWLSFLFSCTSTNTDKTQDSATEFTIIPWQKSLPDLTENDNSLRAIVHLHSHYSHDACDGDPQPDGIPDELCLGDLRSALCAVQIDVAFLSDHPAHSSEVNDFRDVFLIREGDTPWFDGDTMIANQMHCPSGHSVWVFPGVESANMMPLALNHHLSSYEGTSADFQEIREQHAISWLAHTEQISVETLLAEDIDGFELYQLHANLDPDIRADFLGLEPLGFLHDVQPFFFPTETENNPPHADLSPLAFLLPNEPSIVALETVGRTKAVGISAGTDAHQNVFPIAAPDGERIDSYRRMMRWFNTRIVVDKDADPIAIREALRDRKTWIAFESFGTPHNFQFTIQDGANVYPIGSEMSFASTMNIEISLPTLDSRSPRSETMPNIETRLIFADAQGRSTLQTWSSSTDSGVVSYPVDKAGIYRVEVWMQPLHLTPYLGDRPEYSENWMPWIYSGAMFVR